MISPTPDSSPAPLRVALCPIHFHPATQFTLPDGVPFVPLNEPMFSGGSERDFEGDRILGLLDPQTEEAEAALDALRDAVRSIYLRHFTDRIAEILKVCANWGVQLVVFPEFSIPGECLLSLAPMARGMTVVFGSHTVTSSQLKDVSIYKSPGWSAVVEGDTVAPVLMPEGEWRLGARYSPGKLRYWMEEEQPIRLPTGHNMIVIPWTSFENEVHPKGKPFSEAVRIANLIVVPRCFMPGQEFRLTDPNALPSDYMYCVMEPISVVHELYCSEFRASPNHTYVVKRFERKSYETAVSLQKHLAELIRIIDLRTEAAEAMQRVVETSLVPHIVLNGFDAPWIQMLRRSDDLSFFRQTVDAHRADIKQWQSTLLAQAGTLATNHPLRSQLLLWRTKLRQLLDPHQSHTLKELRQAVAGYLPLPPTCPAPLDLELGLARAAQHQLTAHTADWLGSPPGLMHDLVLEFSKKRGLEFPPDSYRLNLENKITAAEKLAPNRLADTVRDQVLALASSRQAISTTPRSQTNSPIHLTRLSLENIRSFASLELPLHVHHPEEGQWILLLGDNGTGKSTILRALVLALADRGVAESLVSDAQTPFRREGEASGRLRVTLNGEPASRDASILPFENREELKREEHPGDARDFNLFAYGCQRGSALGGHAREVSFTPRSDVATLFDEAASLTHAETWLTRLYALALRSNGASLRFFEAVRQSLCGLLPGVESLEFDDQGVWWINGPKVGRARLAALSDGYLTTLGWIIDLIARWSERMQRDGIALDGDFTQHMTGIVVIDEIDLHLHPLWQVSIVTELRRLFPRMSFIATTHNPLTLLGARPGEVHVLRRSQDNANIIVHQVDVPEGTRADQVLTGEWFGLPSTLDENTLELMEEHRALLREGRPTTDPRRLELEALLRERLGTFEDTALDRIAQSVAAQVIRENYRELSIEERKGIRAKILEAVRAQEAKGKK